MTARVAGIIVVAALARCEGTSVTILTQPPPGREAVIDAANRTLRISQGLAIALECSEWSDTYRGPCRDLQVVSGDEGVVEVLPVHLDALAGQLVSDSGGFNESALAAPAARAGAVLAALSPGSTTVEISTTVDPMTLDVVVVPPPAQPDDG